MNEIDIPIISGTTARSSYTINSRGTTFDHSLISREWITTRDDKSSSRGLDCCCSNNGISFDGSDSIVTSSKTTITSDKTIDG